MERVRMREQKKALATSSSRREAKQRKYSNPILISDNSHSLNLFEWKESCSGEEKSEQRQQRNWTSFRVAAPHTVYIYMLESEVASVWVGEMANKWIELNLIHRHCFQLVSHLIVLPLSFPLPRRRRLYGCCSILHRHRSIPPHSLMMLLLSPGPSECLMKMYRERDILSLAAGKILTCVDNFLCVNRKYNVVSRCVSCSWWRRWWCMEPDKRDGNSLKIFCTLAIAHNSPIHQLHASRAHRQREFWVNK